METATIAILQQADGSFIPHPMGMGQATVSYNYTIEGKTAIIAFNGMNQAAVTFDAVGAVVSYSMFNPMATMQDQLSVENIARHLTSATATLH